MRYNVLIDRLQNLIKRKPSQSEIGMALGLAQTAISGRANRNSNFNDEEVEKIEKHFKVTILEDGMKALTLMPLGGTVDRVEIGYWEELPDDLKKSKVQSVWFDREIIENDWEMNPDNLRIIPMIGDKMTHYWYPIYNNDILIVDTNQDYIMGNGVYFATSRNNTRFWIREMQVLINDDIQVKGYAPSGETTKVFKPEQLKDVDFKIIGKVIKNVSFRL